MYKFGPKNSKGQSDSVIRLSDNKQIQLKPSDPNFAEFISWTTKGNTPEMSSEKESIEIDEKGEAESAEADGEEGQIQQSSLEGFLAPAS